MTDAVPLDVALASRPTPARLGRPHRHLASVGSTQEALAEWAAAGAPPGALVTADHQTAGRGRLGRGWHDEPGQDLALSLLLRPDGAADRLGLLPIAAGLAVGDAVAPYLGPTALKWPNDVLYGGAKLAGVLAETAWGSCAVAGAPRPTVRLGIGVNVNRQRFGGALDRPATSLALALGQPVGRADVLAALLAALDARLAALASDPGAILADAEARLAGRGRAVAVAFPGTDAPPAEGTAVGLCPDGALRLATADGERRVYAGEATVVAA